MLRALVVEDNLSEANRIRTVCEKAGFEVSVAASISEAENLLSAHRYTLAILDLSLSDRSSSSLFDEITEKSLVSNVYDFDREPFFSFERKVPISRSNWIYPKRKCGRQLRVLVRPSDKNCIELVDFDLRT